MRCEGVLHWDFNQMGGNDLINILKLTFIYLKINLVFLLMKL